MAAQARSKPFWACSAVKRQPGQILFVPCGCVRTHPSQRLHAQTWHFVVAVDSHHLHLCWSSFGLILQLFFLLAVPLTFFRTGGMGLGIGGGSSARGLWNAAAVVLFGRVVFLMFLAALTGLGPWYRVSLPMSLYAMCWAWNICPVLGDIQSGIGGGGPRGCGAGPLQPCIGS